ncbi:tropomyosin-2-like [Nicotiana sylvestris]|uniref:tropomyosin-2-like n=1 Tax=Nicotiana sylvestris TaxID=4096 RepID=UPI00388C8ADE
MKQVVIEVPADGNLLRKSGGADVWLKPLIGPIEIAKLESHNSLTWMNDIIQSSLKINLIGTEMMKRVSHTEQLIHEYQVEADNWREQYENLQIDMEELEENKCTLEQQLRILTSELAVERASSNQAGKDKNLLETSFFEQLSKASEEIRELKALLSKKGAYAGELVQTLIQTQEDLRESSDKVRSLESSHASLQTSYDSALAENEKLKNEIAEWEKDYEILEYKSAIETQQGQDFPSSVAETSEHIEDDLGMVSVPTPSKQLESTAIGDPASVPTSTP